MPASTSLSFLELESLLREKCRISEPRDFQVQHGLDLIHGKDLFLVAAPGLGKTIVMAAPMLAAQELEEEAIALVIVPSKILTEQQAHVFTDYGLTSLAINEDTLRQALYDRRDLMNEISHGEGVRVAVVTPWMLQNDRLGGIISSTKTRASIRWFLIDEVHLANKNDPSVWREVYTALTYMRARLPSHVVWGAFTGTATKLETSQISRSLGFRLGSFVDARYTLDRQNVKYIPRFLEHSYSGAEFLDLSFLIPHSLVHAGDIPSTLIFCQTIELGHRVMCFLDSLLPAALPNRDRLIMPCSSLLDIDERDEFKTGINSGSIRIGIVTDTCTYGFNILVSRVVTLSIGEIPPYSKLVQQWGRVARDGSPGLVYAFIPAWVRVVPPEEVQTKQQKEDQARRESLPQVIVDWFNSSATRCPREVHLSYNDESIICPELCCSKHQPDPEEESDRNAVSAWKERLEKACKPKERAPRSDGTFCPLEPHMKQAVERILHRWRVQQWIIISGEDCHWPSTMFLPTSTLSRLCEKIHVCTSPERLGQVLGHWDYWTSHGTELYKLVAEILVGFDEIFRDRGESSAKLTAEAKTESTPGPEQGLGSASQQRPLRVVLKLGPASSATRPRGNTTGETNDPPTLPMVPKKRKEVEGPTGPAVAN